MYIFFYLYRFSTFYFKSDVILRNTDNSNLYLKVLDNISVIKTN
jgi:hypothetical protein